MEPLKSFPWFGPSPPKIAPAPVRTALLKAAPGIAMGALLLGAGHRVPAIVVGSLSILVALVSLLSGKGQTAIAAVAKGIATAVSAILLAPVYLVGFTTARLLNRLSGRDPLHLRDADRPSFWLECDGDDRKVRNVRRMFATETTSRAPRTLLTWAVGAAFLVIASELLLRFLGFGQPVLYRSDALAGYYPVPGQSTSRQGGKVEINRFGMRAPDFEPAKPDGTLRILMLGDSTLYGGSYVDQEEIYARRVARMLQQRCPGKRIEVLNMGVNGWGPFNKLGYLEKFGTFGADIAVVCFPIQDISRPLARLNGTRFMPEHSPVPLALAEVGYHLIWHLQQRTIGPENPEEENEHARLGIRAYVELCRRLRAAGCRVFAEILPSEPAGTTATVPEQERQWVDRTTEALEKEGFTVSFPAGLFHKAKADDRIYHDDCHLDREGHRLYADFLAERLTPALKP